MLIACIVGCGGCNAMIDFGFKFGSDGGQGDAGSRDAGQKPDTDGGDKPVDGGDTMDASQSDGGNPGSDGGDRDAATGNDASTCPSQSEDCSNDDDDDCDGLEDCRDPDCAEAPVCCRPTQIPEVTCSGGIDNDCDQDVDCADSDCSVSPLCCTASAPEVGMINCMDSTDNDCDGLFDCQEFSCKSQAHCCDATGDENNATACDDNVDNDCDGTKDCADSECFRTLACCSESPSSNETSCTDNNDEDCDGLADCQDPDCATNLACVGCVPTSTTENSCGDGVDNDCDLNRDCRDGDCYNTTLCCTLRGSSPENSIGSCTDGDDNDCDGLTDCGDPDCSGQQFCCVVAPENTEDACRDTIDNDCDSKLNCGDDSCSGTVECCDETGPENSLTACMDTADNDCDGKLNCADPDCAGTTACCTATSGETTILGVGCCTPDGMNETSAPNDGKDNDCDGTVDKPVLNSAFPIEGLPASGAEVGLTFMTEIVATAQLQCLTRRVGATEPSAFTQCPMSGTTVKPFTALASSKPENNGLWETTVRWQFGSSGPYSEEHVFKYYLHNTLHGVGHCPTPHTPAAWFAKAATRLGTKSAGTFSSNDTFLASPFIRVKYQVPVSSVPRFELNGQSPSIEMLSLRRRFLISPDNQYILITRNYRATRSGGCAAAGVAVHNQQRGFGNSAFRYYGCDAIVLNRAGVGVCMNAGNPSPVFPPNTDQNDYYANLLGWDKANKFMWRNLIELGGGGRVNFTYKCKTTPCSGGIYLPDSHRFGQ